MDCASVDESESHYDPHTLIFYNAIKIIEIFVMHFKFQSQTLLHKTFFFSPLHMKNEGMMSDGRLDRGWLGDLQYCAFNLQSFFFPGKKK